MALSINWKNYDDAYRVWQKYKAGDIERRQALNIIRDKYAVRLFSLLYPLYKTARPFRKLLGLRRLSIRSFDPSKSSMLLVSDDARQRGAPLIAFNLLEKLAARYNVITVLLGPGRMENAFRNVSSVTAGPFPPELRLTRDIHKPIMDVCRKFAPAFAIVNSIESREALIPLSAARVPSVLLVHELVSPMRPDMYRVVTSAGQMVFPARLVWEDAAGFFPPLAGRPVNIITQGRARIPREWLDGEAADNRGKRTAEVLRPIGADDNRVVVMGCGTVDFSEGVDLFISVAAALRRRLSSHRFRFVWAGKEIGGAPTVYSRFLAAQVNCSGLQETMTFLGEVNSIESVYAMADIFLLSSRLDPLPNAAIDAMMAGVPVVCFRNASGVAEMLLNHADLKRLVVPYADVESAAEVIEQLSTDDCYYKSAQAAIQDLALSAFDMENYAARVEQVAERATLIRMQEEDDFATISRSGAFIMEYAAPPGFSGSKDTYVKNFVRRESTCGSNVRRPFPGFHPGIYRNVNPELNDPPFINPFAHYLRSGQPQGPWLLDIIKPEHPAPVHDPLGPPTALHLHIYYPDLTEEILRPFMANHQRPDLFVTVSSEERLREVAGKSAKLGITIRDIMVVPNRGRDIGPLLTLLGRRLIEDYEIVGHLHAKRTSFRPKAVGEAWRTFCFENLLGGKHAMMDLILARFARNPKLGLVFPCDPNNAGWSVNRPAAEALLERMGIAANLPEDFFFPVGTMFWARTDAIAPLLDLDLGWDDYPTEPLPNDGTILHAIERLLPVVAQHRGFEIAGTYVPGVTNDTFSM